MKKLYDEFLSVPEQGKIREKVMLTRITLTALIMILCLAAMGVTAYAYFSCNVTSGFNVIRAANFDAEVSVWRQNGEEVTLTHENGNTHIATLSTDTYTINISMSSNSTATTGFCIVTVDGVKYHTQQLSKNETTPNSQSFSFTLEASSSVDLRILEHWGTSSSYCDPERHPNYIQNGNILTLPLGSGVSEDPSADTETMKPSGNEAEEILYRVVANDTLSGIAERYGTSVEKLKAYNHLSSNTIWVDQELKIPPSQWRIPLATTDQTDSAGPEEGESSRQSQTTTAQPSETTDLSHPTDEPEESTHAFGSGSQGSGSQESDNA